MRLAIVTHDVVRGDGQGRVMLEVAREARRRGHTLALIAVRVDPQLAADPGVAWHRLAVERIPTQLLRNRAFAALGGRAVRESGADLVVACGASYGGPCDLNAVHFVHRAWWRSPSHTRHVARGPRAAYQALYTALNVRYERAAFRRSRHLVAVSDVVAGELAAAGFPGAEVIPNGVDVEAFHPGAEARAPLGLPAGVPLALFAGDARTPRKNLGTVLRALAAVDGLHLAVAGRAAGGPYPAQAEALGVAGRVHWLGFRDDLPALMRAADLFVLPTRYEPFGLVVLEAMASGIPVVTSAVAGVAALVPDDAGVVLSDPDDAQALAATLRQLTADPDRRATLGRRARAAAEAHTERRMAARYVDRLEALHAGRAVASAS